MSVLTELYGKSSHHLPTNSCPVKVRRSRITLAQVSEAVWGIVTFALFLALGPFSAIAVVLSLGSLARGQEDKMEPHAAH